MEKEITASNYAVSSGGGGAWGAWGEHARNTFRSLQERGARADTAAWERGTSGEPLCSRSSVVPGVVFKGQGNYCWHRVDDSASALELLTAQPCGTLF